MRLGTAYLSGLGLPQIAQPHLERLSAQLGESTSAAVLDGDEIVYVARVPTSRIMRVSINVGTRFPAYATSMGRVLLAALPDRELEERLARIEIRPLTKRTVRDHEALRQVLGLVRRQGYAVADQELEDGLRSGAVPIRDASGAVVAALNVSVHASRTTMPALRTEFIPRALKAAEGIEADLRDGGLRATGAKTGRGGAGTGLARA